MDDLTSRLMQLGNLAYLEANKNRDARKVQETCENYMN